MQGADTQFPQALAVSHHSVPLQPPDSPQTAVLCQTASSSKLTRWKTSAFCVIFPYISFLQYFWLVCSSLLWCSEPKETKNFFSWEGGRGNIIKITGKKWLTSYTGGRCRTDGCCTFSCDNKHQECQQFKVICTMGLPKKLAYQNHHTDTIFWSGICSCVAGGSYVAQCLFWATCYSRALRKQAFR